MKKYTMFVDYQYVAHVKKDYPTYHLIKYKMDNDYEAVKYAQNFLAENIEQIDRKDIYCVVVYGDYNTPKERHLARFGLRKHENYLLWELSLE